jgi:hypothetical protein
VRLHYLHKCLVRWESDENSWRVLWSDCAAGATCLNLNQLDKHRLDNGLSCVKRRGIIKTEGFHLHRVSVRRKHATGRRYHLDWTPHIVA